MKIKFNKFERVAGLFVLTAILGSLAGALGVAIKRGWFESKVELETTFETADGLRVGTIVQMAGLRAGAVESVDLKSNNEIVVHFRISKKFHDRIREDSVVRVMRPFVIGEKVLEITVGSPEGKIVAAGGHLKSEPTADIMDLLNGRTLGAYVHTLGKMADNLKFVAESLLDPERTKKLVQIFDETMPLVKNMNEMSSEVTLLLKQTNKKKQLTRIVNNLADASDEINKLLPLLRDQGPALGQDLTKIAKNLAILTDEFQKLVPVVSSVAPEIPGASRRALEALDETVVTLKALQKSFILRANVKEVREEEAQRQPAGKTP